LQDWSDRVEQGKIDVELQKLRETINQLYFSVLLAGEQLQLVQLVDKDLDAGIARVRAQVDNGTAFRSALASLQAERIRNRQRLWEWESTRRGLLDVLSLYIGQQLPDNTSLTWPDAGALERTPAINRSEIALLHVQDSLLLEKDRSIDIRNRPKVSAFLQAGYGRPGLNMLKNEFDPFYITGVRFQWGLSGLYNTRRDRSLLEVQRQVLTVQEDQVMLQTRVRLGQQLAEIRKWERVLPADAEIVALREEVREATRAQLENGVATASDYIREVNAADQARIQAIVHRLQLIQAVVQYRTMAGQDMPKP
jgi:outer membrane protein TolC